ncbi:hypothetical protein MPNT_170055 [Candidatus Methylacidithermus pantelleriae]|uniref:Type I restriction enzyme HindI endonuclease subunit-like C-terminal domain-containing protein n=1 Tax=Candidatus Methylacidithermus pantelleriae TaxID=2744239 RepID=A0A8J2FNC0_9BACT|nr:hypothetical protein MPNT_170055 [Candidatus Methylacidithermus pantelleriae]
MLEETIRRYQNRAIEELIAFAREMREADLRGERLSLCEGEPAF